jgi:uncharacterized protein YbaR (Trm112 family)
VSLPPPDMETPDGPPDPASTAAAPHPEAHGFDRRMLETLVCPATRAPLAYDPARQELVSRAAHLAYPIRDGIPIMLVHEARETE